MLLADVPSPSSVRDERVSRSESGGPTESVLIQSAFSGVGVEVDAASYHDPPSPSSLLAPASARSVAAEAP